MGRTVVKLLAAGLLLGACGAHGRATKPVHVGKVEAGHQARPSPGPPASAVPSGGLGGTTAAPPPPPPTATAVATRTQLVKCHGPIPEAVTTLLQNVTLCAWVVEASSGAAVRSGSLSVQLAQPWPYDQPSCVGTLPAWVLDPSASVPGGAALSVQDPSVASMPSGTVLAYCNQDVGITNPAPYPAEVVARYQPGPGYAASSASHWTLPAPNAP